MTPPDQRPRLYKARELQDQTKHPTRKTTWSHKVNETLTGCVLTVHNGKCQQIAMVSHRSHPIPARSGSCGTAGHEKADRPGRSASIVRRIRTCDQNLQVPARSICSFSAIASIKVGTFGLTLA